MKNVIVSEADWNALADRVRNAEYFRDCAEIYRSSMARRYEELCVAASREPRMHEIFTAIVGRQAVEEQLAAALEAGLAECERLRAELARLREKRPATWCHT